MWSAIAEAREPVNSFAALLLAALLSAVISLSDETVLRDYGVARSSLIEGMKAAAETALCKSKFLQTTKLETIQAFVLYLVCGAQARYAAGCIRLTVACAHSCRSVAVRCREPIQP